MGRHGGGSRSGGFRGSSSRSGGSSSGVGSGSKSRVSHRPFAGCYNRSYYTSSGKYVACYAGDSSFGTDDKFRPVTIIALLFITVHMIFALGGTILSNASFGQKIDGDASRISIDDKIDLLTDREEQRLLSVFSTVYEKSGMPITLVIDDLSWRHYWEDIQAYSEDRYYAMGSDENAAIIVYTVGDVSGFQDWEWDLYCGDGTVACLSDQLFDEIARDIQAALYSSGLCDTLVDVWSDAVKDMATTSFDLSILPVVLLLLVFYGIFYYALLLPEIQSLRAYHYYKQHPDAWPDVQQTEQTVSDRSSTYNSDPYEV